MEIVAGCLACVIACGALLEAAHGARLQHEFYYTDLWMVPSKVDHPTYATIGVRNEERQDASYRVEIIARGALVDRFPSFRLRPGEQHVFRIAMPSMVFSAGLDDAPSARPLHDDAVSPVRIEARLYKDGNRAAVYRTVWAALPPAAKADGAERSDVGDQTNASKE